MSFICSRCGHKCRDNYNLKRHQKSHIEERRPPKMLRKADFTCFHCQRKLTRKHDLVRHIKIHFSPSKKPPLQCPLCCSKFYDRITIETHFSRDHRVTLDKIRLSFDNKEDVNKWKSDLEVASVSSFVVGDTNNNVVYFRCFRSGSAKMKSMESRKRLPKLLGTPKMGAFCPAHITMTIGDGRINVVYCGTHMGHDFKVARLHLTKSYRKSLAVKMRMKIPFDDIIASEREKAKMGSQQQLQRSLLLTRQDLYNISREFGVQRDVILHPNDAVSVEAWVNKNQASESPSVRYNKFNGELDPEHTELHLDDFVLILMSDTQIEMLKNLGNDVVCVDGTHGTNGYGFEMTTVLVLNDRKEGFPVATMFSSRSDTEMMTVFFTYIRKLCGGISCRVFMTDITEIYFQAWKKTMGTPSRRLFCSWHVDQAWRKNLNKVKGGQSIKKLVYKKIKIVQMERDVHTFNTMLDNLINNDLLVDPNTQHFGEYIRDHYGNTTQHWAYCHRLNAGVNTNTHLERMHGIFKYFYLKGKKTKRLDKALHALENFIKSKLFDEFVSTHKGKLSKKLQTLRGKHRLYQKESDKMQVLQLHSDEWLVSSTALLELYNVIKVQHSCEECTLKCDWCKACIHSYVCTCLDNSIRGNMCKHIHKVCDNLNNTPSCDSYGPSIVIESANDNFIIPENFNAMKNVENAVLREILTEPSTVNINKEEKVEKLFKEFQKVVNKAANDEQFAVISKAIVSADATISALQQQCNAM